MTHPMPPRWFEDKCVLGPSSPRGMDDRGGLVAGMPVPVQREALVPREMTRYFSGAQSPPPVILKRTRGVGLVERTELGRVVHAQPSLTTACSAYPAALVPRRWPPMLRNGDSTHIGSFLRLQKGTIGMLEGAGSKVPYGGGPETNVL